MDPAKLEAMLFAKDWSAIDQVGSLGSAALPTIDRALHAPEPEVRQITVLCLEHIKGPQAAALLVRTLDDSHEQVRAYAADMLFVNHHPSVLPALQDAMARHADARIRVKTALVTGLIGDRSSVDPLERALRTESDLSVRDGLQQALARLGDAEARTAILRQLMAHDKRTQFEALARIEFINDRALVRNVAPLLGDASPVLTLMDDGTHREVLRLQDAAAKTIAVLLGQPFTFKLEDYRVCTDAELREIRSHLVRLGPIH
jgi:HEAT repeat protein